MTKKTLLSDLNKFKKFKKSSTYFRKVWQRVNKKLNTVEASVVTVSSTDFVADSSRENPRDITYTSNVHEDFQRRQNWVPLLLMRIEISIPSVCV